MLKYFPTIVGGALFLWSLFSKIWFSVATVQCFNCRGEECQTGDGHLETCVRYDDVCVTWRYRKPDPGKGIKAGDVYRKGCAVLLVVIEGCRQDGKYDRCVCRTSSCNGMQFGAPTTTPPPIVPQGRTFDVTFYQSPETLTETEVPITKSTIPTSTERATVKPESDSETELSSGSYSMSGRTMGKDDFVDPSMELDKPSSSTIGRGMELKNIFTTTTPETPMAVTVKSSSTVYPTTEIITVPTVNVSTTNFKTTLDPRKSQNGKSGKQRTRKKGKIDPEVQRMIQMFSTSSYDD